MYFSDIHAGPNSGETKTVLLFRFGWHQKLCTCCNRKNLTLVFQLFSKLNTSRRRFLERFSPGGFDIRIASVKLQFPGGNEELTRILRTQCYSNVFFSIFKTCLRIL